MPQMSPMNWILLFILFTLFFYLFSMMNYFSFMPSMPKYKSQLFSLKTMNWKW